MLQKKSPSTSVGLFFLRWFFSVSEHIPGIEPVRKTFSAYGEITVALKQQKQTKQSNQPKQRQQQQKHVEMGTFNTERHRSHRSHRLRQL